MKYTILPGIVRTEVCGETMLVACGKAPYARTLNETAAFLWKQLELGRDEAAIIAALTEEYGIDEQTAQAAYSSFAQKLKESGYLLEE